MAPTAWHVFCNTRLARELCLQIRVQLKKPLSPRKIMADIDIKVALEAAVLSCGYNVGYFLTLTLSMAERQIERHEDPSATIIDLALIRNTNPIDVMDMLRSLSGRYQTPLL